MAARWSLQKGDRVLVGSKFVGEGDWGEGKVLDTTYDHVIVDVRRIMEPGPGRVPGVHAFLWERVNEYEMNPKCGRCPR